MGKPDLRLGKEVRALLKSGRVYRGRLLHVRIGGSELSRTLISVRRKFGPAVARNRVRRRIRHLCREWGLLQPNHRLIFVTISDSAASATFQELKADFECAVQALDLTQNK